MIFSWYLILVTYNGALASTPMPTPVFSTYEKCKVAEKIANKYTEVNGLRGFYCVPRMADEVK